MLLPGVGQTTANRVRQVQDILVAVQKLEGEVKVVFGMGEAVGIPVNEHFFKAKKVTIKQIVKKEKVW